MAGDYSQAWREYRKTRNRVLIVVVGYLPVVLLLVILMPASMLVNNGSNYIFGFVNLVWLGLFVVAVMRLRNWLCPRCGEKFGLRFGANQCANCALSKYAEEPTHTPATADCRVTAQVPASRGTLPVSAFTRILFGFDAISVGNDLRAVRKRSDSQLRDSPLRVRLHHS